MTLSVDRPQTPFPRPIREGSWLVPTDRLRRALLTRELEEQKANGYTLALAPMIEQPAEWARRHWDAIATETRLLPPAADRGLWLNVVRETVKEVGKNVQYPLGLARLAQEAFALEAEWQIDEKELGAGGTQENEIYCKLRARFLERIRDGGFESQGRLLARVVQALEDGSLEEPDESLTFFGFDELTPLALRLDRAARARGCRCLIQDGVEGRLPAELSVRAYPDRSDELYAMAKAVQFTLAENPAHRIGVILLGGSRYRAQLRAVLADVFDPPRLTSDRDPSWRPYSLSLGDPLSDYALVETALDVLDVADRNHSGERLSRLLRSPYWGEIRQDGPERFAADRAWRNLGRSVGNTWLTLITLAECPKDFRDRSLVMMRRLESFDPLRKRAFSEWVRLWMGLLDDIGWPGAQTLDSTEYQTYEAWLETIQSFFAMDMIDGLWSLAEFREWVGENLRERIFQPESRPAPISVMDPLESAGLTFDELWILGAEAEVWPSHPHPHPFLPFSLQRQRGLPHADSQRELRFGERLVARWKHAAPVVHVSWTTREGETDHDLSPYFLQDACSGSTAFRERGFRARWRGRAWPLEAVPFTDPVPWTDLQIHGGTRLLENQAACPFMAFAIHRLKAEGLAPWRLPLDPLDRGRILHKMLENIGSFGLSSLEESSLREWTERIREAVDRVLKAEIKEDRLVRTLYEALREDFIQCLCSWFEKVEAVRKNPFHSDLERQSTLDLAGIRFQIRADRIDRFPDGTAAIVDYKTGKPPNPSDWVNSERLLQPQLPAYALAWPEARALLVACLNRSNPDSQGYRGVRDQAWTNLDEATLIQVPDWETKRQEWRNALEALAQEIRLGRNDLDPRGKGGLPCQWCDFPALCRLHERPQITDQEDEEESEGPMASESENE